jgi:hypothetical protein
MDSRLALRRYTYTSVASHQLWLVQVTAHLEEAAPNVPAPTGEALGEPPSDSDVDGDAMDADDSSEEAASSPEEALYLKRYLATFEIWVGGNHWRAFGNSSAGCALDKENYARSSCLHMDASP